MYHLWFIHWILVVVLLSISFWLIWWRCVISLFLLVFTACRSQSSCFWPYVYKIDSYTKKMVVFVASGVTPTLPLLFFIPTSIIFVLWTHIYVKPAGWDCQHAVTKNKECAKGTILIVADMVFSLDLNSRSQPTGFLSDTFPQELQDCRSSAQRAGSNGWNKESRNTEWENKISLLRK